MSQLHCPKCHGTRYTFLRGCRDCQERMAKANPKPLEHMTEPELNETIGAVGTAIRDVLVDRTGKKKPLFVCIMFDDPKIAQYCSSCDRSTMIEALREAAARLEAMQDVPREVKPS